jgi:hypothetical protein
MSATTTGPNDWAPCHGHPPQATAGFVGCSDHWPPPPDDDPPGDHSARLAEASAKGGGLDAAAAPAPATTCRIQRLSDGGS